MKNKIINFLFKKRIKILKSKKGFSLIEVLVAVGIIGIISAIAYPAFDEYRQNAARVASDTSGSNIIKAFKTCLVLKSFATCSASLTALKIPCPSGSTCKVGKDSGGTKFCAEIKKGSTNSNDFNVCVSYDVATQSEERKYGGTLLDKICKIDQTGTGCTTTIPVTPLTTCSQKSDCGTLGSASTGCTKTAGSESCASSGDSGTCGAGVCS